MPSTMALTFSLAPILHTVASSVSRLSNPVVGVSVLTSRSISCSYVDQKTAISKNLSYTNSNTLIMRADYTTALSSSGPGRDSVRIQSKKAYGFGVTIVNVRAMPVGCGTWPALWSNANGVTWPQGGEIDMIEGVNSQGASNSVLHTSWNCAMDQSSMVQTGAPGNLNCTSTQNSNAGCIVQPQPSANSFGPNFNAEGGGWYAVGAQK
ncbi:hypothetical protein FRB94_001089 [Tulasnella sp. JGI-2019a]|nr:hypothetical protein FRB93_000426 [Tulasnella sp. JGI-2019a]KAG9005961.1 hypothetical protein FRB94_001089 [Tulasnella sp. JGI-2019a]